MINISIFIRMLDLNYYDIIKKSSYENFRFTKSAS